MSILINLELGHEASIRAKKTAEGLTHDWEVYVKGCDGANISYYVERVVFYLHESFPKPKRVIKEPPYFVRTSGYAGFVIPIEIYLKNNQEPKKIKFNYDLSLQESGPPIHRFQREKYIFQAPSEEFKSRLLRGGGINATSVSSLDSLESRSLEEKNQMSSKPKLSSSELVRKKPKEDNRAPDSFRDLFGPPITKTKPEIPKPKDPPKAVLKNDKSKDPEKPKSKSPYKDKDREREKSKDKIEADKKKDKEERKNKERKERERSKEKSAKKEKEKSPVRRSLSPKRSPKRAVSPVSKHANRDATKDKERKDEKKAKKEKREHKENKHKEREKSGEHKEYKKEKDLKVKELVKDHSPSPLQQKVDKKEKKEKEREEEKAEKRPEKIEDRQKHKHKKKDKERKDKQDKHKSERRDKVEAKPLKENGREVQPAPKEDKSSLFGSPKSSSPTEVPVKKDKPAALPSFVVEESSNSSKNSSRESSPVVEVRPPSPPPEIVRKIGRDAVEGVVKKKDKKEKKKEKRVDKDHEKKRKRKSEGTVGIVEAEPPPEKIIKSDEVPLNNNSDDERKVTSSDNISVKNEENEAEDYMGVLRELQHKIMGLKDNSDLQKVVQLIAETGRYEVSAHTFDFDLCLLDRSTVTQLQEFFQTIS